MTNDLEKMMTEIQALSDDEIRTLDVSAAQRLCGRLDKALFFAQTELMKIDAELTEANAEVFEAKRKQAKIKGRLDGVKRFANYTIERMRNVKAFVSNSY